MANFFAEYTDVWTFGTADDYRAFADHLRRHAAGHADHTSIPPDRSSPGMDVLLLPTCVDATRPFLVIQERMIRQKKRTNMELIIGGTSEGFAYLEYQFLEIIQNAEGDPSDHIHVDLNTELLEFPTVFLNIRGPARMWSKECLDPYWDFCVLPGSPHRMPEPSGEGWSYSRIDYDSMYGRFPRAGEAEPGVGADSR